MSEFRRQQKTGFNPNTDRFSINRSDYYTYHAEVAFSFKKDIEKFLSDFEKLKTFSFETFAAVWCGMRLSLVFAGQEFLNEVDMFLETSFYTIKKYMLFSESIYIKVGAFYLLYALYSKQPCRDVIKIRLNPEEYLVIQSLIQKMEEADVKDVAGVFTKLKCLRAFQFVAKPRCYGLEGKFMWQEKKMKNDTFVSTNNINPVEEVGRILYSDEFYGLNYLSANNKEYMENLKKYGVVSATLEAETITQQLENVYNEMAEPLNQNNETDEDKEDMHAKRTKLKLQAYTTEVPALRMFKTEVIKNE